MVRAGLGQNRNPGTQSHLPSECRHPGTRAVTATSQDLQLAGSWNQEAGSGTDEPRYSDVRPGHFNC